MTVPRQQLDASRSVVVYICMQTHLGHERGMESIRTFLHNLCLPRNKDLLTFQFSLSRYLFDCHDGAATIAHAKRVNCRFYMYAKRTSKWGIGTRATNWGLGVGIESLNGQLIFSLLVPNLTSSSSSLSSFLLLSTCYKKIIMIAMVHS